MTTQPTIAPDSELARAYRAARRYHGESGGHGPHRRPAALAVAEARRRLATVAAMSAAYDAAEAQREAADATAARNPSAQSWGPYLQSLTTAAHKARTAKADAMARAGLFHSGPDSWRIWPAATMSEDGTALHLAHESGLGAVRGVVKADSVVKSLPSGWYDNPHGESFRDGSGLIFGVVASLPHGRFLAGWQAGGCDGGPTLSTRIFGGPGLDPEESAEDAARYADGMAERVAEDERAYREGWEAGTAWAEAGERLAELGAELRALLAERRALRPVTSPGRWPAICATLRQAVADKLAERAELRAERAELADSWADSEGWAEGAGA
jgi:hypothetical protein